MDETKKTLFLFDISNEIKHFYESPVIFLFKKNYSDEVFDAMCTIRSHKINDVPKSVLFDDVVEFHLKWLHLVNDIEINKKRIPSLSKEDVCEAIHYTLNALKARYKYYERYVKNNSANLSNAEKAQIETELELVDSMHTEVTQILQSKVTCFSTFTDHTDFLIRLNSELDDLFTFLDDIFDELSLLLSKHINENLPELASDLTKTLQNLVEKISDFSNTPSAINLIEELKSKGKDLGSLVHHAFGHGLEISKINEKIGNLEDRIDRLKNEKTSVVKTSLQNKKEILENRLVTLENLKINLNAFHQSTNFKYGDPNHCLCREFCKLKIFNHLLPQSEREKLVTELCKLWKVAILDTQEGKSLISILSTNESKEMFTDVIGTFYVDGLGRKIYKKEGDETMYQLNEHNILVELTDDSDHIYFYDECGRYYINKENKLRVYKATDTESEYIMDSSGILVKSKEIRDNVIYYYDIYGRYYINEEGKQIYRDADSISEYENDGLGNLVRIRTFMDIFDKCPDDANVTEDFRYLKSTVGPALKECIAEVILRQPDDPLRYLSGRLLKFRENLELKERMALENEAATIEREAILEAQRAAAERAALEAALLAQGGSEASYDSNVSRYIHENLDDTMSIISK